MKTCSKCKKHKILLEFGKDKTRKSGLDLYCKECKKEYRDTHKKESAHYQKIYQLAYRLKNAEKITVRQSYIDARRDKQKAAVKNANWRLQNKAKVSAYNADYAKKNPGKMNARTMKRYASKLRAAPPWLTESQLLEIQDFYIEAARLTKETGIIHHVDHIIPLQNKDVCGLHVPWNLQILTASENIAKSNKIVL